MRAPWEKLIGDYLRGRNPLVGLVVVMDIRRPMTPLDLYLIEWFSPTLRPIHVLLTKSDKLTKSEQGRTLIATRKELEKLGIRGECMLFSSQNRQGVEETRELIDGWLAGKE